MIVCYLGLYEEGEVEYINGVRPGFLELQLVGRLIERIQSMCAHAHVQGILIKFVMLSHFWPLRVSQIYVRIGHGWVGPLICSTSPSSYNPK